MEKIPLLSRLSFIAGGEHWFDWVRVPEQGQPWQLLTELRSCKSGIPGSLRLHTPLDTTQQSAAIAEVALDAPGAALHEMPTVLGGVLRASVAVPSGGELSVTAFLVRRSD